MRKKFLQFLVLCLITSFTRSPLYARGGGGCLIQGTQIETPSGDVRIEKLKPGDIVFGIVKGKKIPVTIQSLMTVQPDEYYVITLNSTILYATAEHPIQIGPGVFRIASALKPGDAITRNKNWLTSEIVKSVEHRHNELSAYNLLVSPAGTYIANGVIVHNKGCFLPETPVLLANGNAIPISQIKKHDRLLAFKMDGQIVESSVQKVLTHDVDEYCVVRAGSRILNVTKEHPFYVGNGEFRTLEALKIGDQIFIFDGNNLSSQPIESIETIQTKTHVYNIQTDSPNTYFANGAAVHNKGGGCFPAGTPIKTPKGEININQINVGDTVLSVDHEGKPILAKVRETHSTQSPLMTIRTAGRTLITTREHPLALAAGGFRPAGELSVDDEILVWKDGHAKTEKVLERSFGTIAEPVYNLTVKWPNTFIASGFIVHNKGGGFRGGGFRGGGYHGGSGGSRNSNGNDVEDYIQLGFFFLLIFGCIYYFVDGVSSSFKKGTLDFIFKPHQIRSKSEKTLKLIEFIARQDPTVAPDALNKIVENTFLKLQQCWQAREYTPMKLLLMQDLYQEHLKQIQSLVRNHEINIIADLRIDMIDLVNIRYTQKENQREFTALVTATAQDYYIDDRTKNRLRGDDSPAQFQEFWTFHFMNKAWLLREIEQTNESDILKEDNFFEPFTEKGVDQIYGDTAQTLGPAGLGLEKDVEIKGTRIARMLNFLGKTDKLWDRDTMIFTTRRIFMELMMAWESGDIAAIPLNDLFPEFADALKSDILKDKNRGITREFRNLCIRKIELIFVKNYADNSKDEFVARVRAHAQRIMRSKETILHEDDDVTLFEQFLTLGRHDNKWKLKEIITAESGQDLVSKENLDQDSTLQQLNWYYQHKRVI